MTALCQDIRPGEIEVIVVCNGCSDNTAVRARTFADGVRVIETATRSKANALNLGDSVATGYPRFYLDADVLITTASVRKVASELSLADALAAAPRPEDVFFPRTPWAVKAYYKVWNELPYIREGMVAAGVYALSKRGRERFLEFPDIIADDGYVRLQFEPHERILVSDAVSQVFAPTTFHDLLRIRSRIRLGLLQLQIFYPELVRRENETKQYSKALVLLLRRPCLYLAMLVYFYVGFVARLRSKRKLARISEYVWERDESSRKL